MLKDGQIICDSCQKVISRITQAPAEGWEQMHNLCSACYLELEKKAVSRS
jgi:predicted amidophosphoribosyltransferase